MLSSIVERAGAISYHLASRFPVLTGPGDSVEGLWLVVVDRRQEEVLARQEKLTP